MIRLEVRNLQVGGDGGGEWLAVEARGPYGVERDTFNRVQIAPVTATGLRLEVTLQPKWSAGIQEWRVR